MKQFAFELLCVICVAGIPLAVWGGGLQAWITQTLLGYASTWIDWIAFPHTENNLKLLEKAGYTRTFVWSIMLLNLILTNALVGIVYAYALSKEEHEHAGPLALLGMVLVNLCCTEVFFTISHALLQVTSAGAKLHRLHHCCMSSSWSTNLICHPLDMTAEFSGPVLSVIALHFFVWHDDLALVLTVLAVHMWYALDHSATMKLYHTRHHSHLNNMYSIYVQEVHSLLERSCPTSSEISAGSSGRSKLGLSTIEILVHVKLG